MSKRLLAQSLRHTNGQNTAANGDVIDYTESAPAFQSYQKSESHWDDAENEQGSLVQAKRRGTVEGEISREYQFHEDGTKLLANA